MARVALLEADLSKARSETSAHSFDIMSCLNLCSGFTSFTYESIRLCSQMSKTALRIMGHPEQLEEKLKARFTVSVFSVYTTD